MDATLNGTWLEDRFGDPFVFGVQGGAYLGGLVRAAIRLEMPTDNARDDYSEYDYDSTPVPAPGGQTYTSSNPRNSDPPTLLYGGSLGVVATSSENFVFAPGVVFVRSDVSDYGNMLGISMPFEWVTSRGMRFALELDLGRAFGGKVHNRTCLNNISNGSQMCTEDTIDRPAGRAFALRFAMGFGFSRPR
jgi:hypothetical protein